MSPLRIVTQTITNEEVRRLAEERFGDMVKAVVDIERGVIAIGGELHADGEALLLENGSDQSNLWGINLYPDRPREEWIEFDSMINIRPSQGNRSRSIEDTTVQKKITEIVQRIVIQ
jgi:hypothetical protein